MQSHGLRPQSWVRNQRWCAPDCFDGNDVFGSVGEVEWSRTEMANGRFAISKQNNFREENSSKLTILSTQVDVRGSG